ncbi:membrane protein [Peptostreptococcus sp. MV1]|uniref:MptD family putative ECF transporter S component n=1 Tax=Peptostreptococcus sp. MV1 TaxID=1219626 RepID=UPI000510304F|nr:MptD family putative ECF transporter S component [Peptostreptococcus sp. MV1]KGF14931.1 membrane protein [Peptostreptococcus sp. MV1]
MSKKLKIKDILLLALLTAIYMIIYMVCMAIITPLGAYGHSISPGICGIFSGTVIYFMSRKVGKMWQFTIFTLFVMGVFALMGGGYLPWLITSVSTAIIADIIASRVDKPSVGRLAIASGLIHMGQAWGAIIPSMFFLESYRSTWISRGQKAAEMDAMIKYTAGTWGIVNSLIIFALAVLGVYIGYFILKKHFKE